MIAVPDQPERVASKVTTTLRNRERSLTTWEILYHNTRARAMDRVHSYGKRTISSGGLYALSDHSAALGYGIQLVPLCTPFCQ